MAVVVLIVGRLVDHRGFSGEQQAGDRGGVGQRGAGELHRIDDALGDLSWLTVGHLRPDTRSTHDFVWLSAAMGTLIGAPTPPHYPASYTAPGFRPTGIHKD